MLCLCWKRGARSDRRGGGTSPSNSPDRGEETESTLLFYFLWVVSFMKQRLNAVNVDILLSESRFPPQRQGCSEIKSGYETSTPLFVALVEIKTVST